MLSQQSAWWLVDTENGEKWVSAPPHPLSAGPAEPGTGRSVRPCRSQVISGEMPACPAACLERHAGRGTETMPRDSQGLSDTLSENPRSAWSFRVTQKCQKPSRVPAGCSEDSDGPACPPLTALRVAASSSAEIPYMSGKASTGCGRGCVKGKQRFIKSNSL